MPTIMPEHFDAKTLFFQGRLEDLLSGTVDNPGSQWMEQCASYALGALSFLGRVEEAEFRLERSGIKEQLSVQDKAACLFYLTVGWVRASEYQKARRCIVENLRLWRQHKSSFEIKAFAKQGLAFFRFFSGRYRSAYRAAESALSAAILADHFFLRMFASDLLGHCRIQLGEISRGLHELELAHKLSRKLGHGAYEKAIFRAILSFRVQYGVLGADNLGVLKELIEETKVEDTYTDTYMVLELARQLTVRGRLSEAEDWLRRLSYEVYASGQPWQKAMLNLRFAEIAYLRRDSAELKARLAAAETEIDREIDLPILVFHQGLKIKAGIDQSEEFRLEHKKSTEKLGSSLARRIACRRDSVPMTASIGEDPLGDFIDGLGETSSLQAIAGIVKSGYFGLLHKVLPDMTAAEALFYHQPSQNLIFLRNGDIHAVELPSNSKLFELLKSLNKGFRTKEDLVKDIYGYEYNPLRHDSLLYTLISRFRALLGGASEWLENHDEGYSLKDSVDLRFSELEKTVERQDLVGIEKQMDMHPRQFAILDLFRSKGQALSLEECAEAFQVSKVTITRDFSALCKAGYLLRLGKGPATHYLLAKQIPSEFISNKKEIVDEI